MRAIFAGFVAGIVSGISYLIFDVSGLYKVFSVLPHIISVPMKNLAIFNILLNVMWGIIFGVFYAFFYNYIPKKGIKKGLVYGLIIWIIGPSNLWITYLAYGQYMWSIPYALSSLISTGITYGLILGYLYKKPTK